jgi:thiazole synthase
MIKEMIDCSPVPLMLDGGVGRVDDVLSAIHLGFDSVLINSCLFANGADPVASLRAFREVIDRTGRQAATGG